jgi:hypothetical protein
MTLDEIRDIIADTTAAHWHTLSGDAPKEVCGNEGTQRDVHRR